MRFLWKMILKEIWQRLSNLNSEIRRGDLYYADLSPVVGSEQGGVRPVLVIQNNIGNKYRHMLNGKKCSFTLMHLFGRIRIDSIPRRRFCEQ